MKLALLLLAVGLGQAADNRHWVATWGASPAPQLAEGKLTLDNQTLRETVHVSIGSDTVRVRLSNAYGKDGVEIGAAHIGVTGSESKGRALTFSGRANVFIPADGMALSDPVALSVPGGSHLSIDIYLPKPTAVGGIHYSAMQTSYTAKGDATGAAALTEPQKIGYWAFLAGVDVLAPASASAIVAFGDSITDGARSTPNTDTRWPDLLAARLRERFGVLNAGIGGNRVLHDAGTNIRFGVNALARFDRDVLAQAGVKYVVVMEGINDLGHPGSSAPASETVTAADLIAGLRQMAERAHELGLKVYGATLTPFEGAGYFTAEKEVKRKAVNEWIRKSGVFDGVVDFDQAVRDPKNPDHILAAYDSGDHLHPGDAGYKAMADAIDLSLFR